ncbi:gag-Pol polyprotein [Caerostris extrusa]|uniref:Gag-Pol polyprotein n=1 Tax=Caerostris extrusa TaxID=172846 RepID=A0AAV4R481_CAEEX|nr:gag-Pol polyprotein [Caerostris extrusa]
MISTAVKKLVELKQDQRIAYYDKKRKELYFTSIQKVWVILHPIINSDRKETSKCMPKRDGPYMIFPQRSSVSCVVSYLDSSDKSIGTYQISGVKPLTDVETTPTAPLRKRGRHNLSDVVSSMSSNLETER